MSFGELSQEAIEAGMAGPSLDLCPHGCRGRCQDRQERRTGATRCPYRPYPSEALARALRAMQSGGQWLAEPEDVQRRARS